MCRLFAQHASRDHDLHEPLCSAANALRVQSHKHPHGWGIGWYDAAGVQLRRGVMAAHVGDASVGAVAEANTHPFVHAQWIFAHNGTVARFKKVARVRAALEAEIDPALRPAVRGDTDSERVFFLFLTRLAARLRPG